MPKRKASSVGDVQSTTKRRKIRPWATMPIEALEKIFSYVVAAEGTAFPCLVTLGKVCRHWKYVADMPHLWSHLRFSPANIPNENHFRRHFGLFRNYAVRFRETHSLVCCGLERSAARIVNEVCIHAIRIRSFALIQCGKMGLPLQNCLKTLTERHGKTVQSFTLRQTTCKASTLNTCLLDFGEVLTTLESTKVPSSYYRGMNCQFGHLSNLTVLKLQGEPDFNLESLKDLHRLRTIHITDSRLVAPACGLVRWPELEDCNFSCSELIVPTADAETNARILQVLNHSPKVKRVELHGRYMDVSSLAKVLQHCNEVEYLNITVKQAPGDHSDGSTIGFLVNCIGDSLRKLYLNESVDLDGCLSASKAYPHYWHQITEISLELTNIKVDTLKFFLNYCLLNVKAINLCTCRDLPRGCKRKWTDISALKKVLKASE